MAAGDRDAVLQPHQLGQQLAARDHGDLQAARFLHLGILFVHRGTDHQRAGARDIGRVVAFVDSAPIGASRSVMGDSFRSDPLIW